MRQLKMRTHVNVREKEFEKFIANSKEKELDDEERNALLKEIRNGNPEPIEKLVDSFETMVLSVAKQIPNKIPIEKLIAIGKDELKKLAKQEINSEIRERFFRFGAWCVRQAIVEKIKEVENKKNNRTI